jgi:hypothetical protein
MRHLAAALTEMGHSISHSVAAKLLRSLGYSLQGTRKKMEGHQHPDRDDQFRYINKLASEFLASGDPVISVDTERAMQDGPRAVPEQTTVFTVKLPTALVARVRERARASGSTISAVVAQALSEFLAR